MADDSPRSTASVHISNKSRPPSEQTPNTKSSKKDATFPALTSNRNVLVYIPDIPLNIPASDLEEIIRTRVETTQRLKISDIKCYVKLGVAVIELMNEADRVHLISTVQSMVLDPKTSINITFSNELDLDSYVVLDRNMPTIPSADDIARRYMQVYKTQELCSCRSISIQFPNIFSISLTTLDELVKVADAPDFKVENTFATVYVRADCSFFEDLPPNTNENTLTSAITAQIDENELLATSFHVQYNKETGNAVVLATKSNKKWSMESSLKIDAHNIPKKTKLAYRVLVSPVPQDFDLNLILSHTLFAHRTVAHNHINDHLIIELDDVKDYDQCITMGALRIGKTTMNITSHTIVSDPDSSEINDENWYETEMRDMKPDIMTIINDYQHPIFRYKWNAENWLQQMKKLKVKGEHSRKYDIDQHLLRVTVMLNTVGVLRKKKYTVDGQDVILKLERMQTIGYSNKAKLSYGKTISETELKPPYKSTSVSVINEDCLVLYETLVNEGYRPLLLNMASATSPGGGYRKGDGAQEENLFRRSDYYQSLDLDVADKDRSERLICTSKCEVKRQTGYVEFYPMEEFGAIYTSGITVFRQIEDNGYAYMKNPLYNVCAIAMAAYRDPGLTDKNMLENKMATKTHKKIENIFSIAHHHQHDCLVLSALGCGAFKNPPEHMALLFKSVIYQYAGFFKKIYFAIVDDHNTGNKTNPNGNFGPFKEILNDLVVHPPKTIRIDGAIGPHRILNKSSNGKITLSDVCIQYLPPCQYGTECHDLKDSQHNKTFSHPPVCLYQESDLLCNQINDAVHMFTFMHKSKCKHGGECTSNDPQHMTDYEHPEFCKNKSDCIDMSSEHLYAYRHLPVCGNGLNCLGYLRRDAEHMSSFRHCKTVCPYDNCCANFHDRGHMKNTIHSFLEPCPFAPYNCSIFVSYIQVDATKTIPPDVENHCLRYAHVCQFGRYCKTKAERHYETCIHITRKPCPQGDQCSKLADEDHLESFSHEGIRDIRLLCKRAGFECRNRYEQQHLTKYRHGRNFNHLSVAPCSNLNTSVNFFHNQGRIIKAVNTYIDVANWEKVKISQHMLNWIKALQPVHRCAKHIFESILVHGHVMSRAYMNLLKQPKFVTKAVLQHNQIRSIFLQHNIPAVKENVKELVKLLVKAEFAKSGSTEVSPLDADHDYKANNIEKKLKPPLDQHDIETIHTWAVKIAQASIELMKHPMGIGFDVDEKMGTDKHIFSILGPHLGYYYGDIVITFKQEIMFHPDANFSMQAGTSFHSARIYKLRPWLTEPNSEDQRIEDFHKAKLHCSYPRYEYAAATELVAFTGRDKKSMNMDIDAVLQQWIEVDSHFVFESHLPQLIPLDYIDKVYIPKNIFELLTNEAKQSAKETFKNSLIIADYTLDLSLIKTGAMPQLDATRKPYLQYIIGQINQTIEERMAAPHISRGFVITVPGTRFDDYIVVPMTISQSYGLYCLNKAQPLNNPEFTYIYWKAMNGDMMLLIANEMIELDRKNQPNLQCLICYVAEKPSTATDDYHEEYSYLNSGRPYQHYNDVHLAHFKAKSNCFYRGCNTDDFFTFCLKITHKTGEISLSHAGPNGIYNHEKIHYQFKKSELDLSRLNYVHISAGNQDVPVRNLTINHEPMLELHPNFDKDFKIDTSGLIRKRRTSFHHTTSGAAVRTQDMRKDKAASKSNIKPAMSTDNQSMAIEKPSFFRRIALTLGCSAGNVIVPSPKPSGSDSSTGHDSRSDSSTLNSQNRSNHSQSKLPPCLDSIYCLNQYSKDHMEKYSHPCRFNEACRNQNTEPHLVHERHDAPMCSDDRDCVERTNPVHRAQYRHTNLPDYLIPCRNQASCRDTSDDHRKKYFHGEELPSKKKNNTSTTLQDRAPPTTARLFPCKYGDQCRSKKDPKHIAKYSHP
ncbi:unnamed protein product [Rotaria magnacalcarata]